MSKDWRFEFIVVVDRTIMIRHTTATEAPPRVSEALHRSVFHAFPHASMKRSKYPFHIPRTRIFHRVQQTASQQINFLRFIIRWMEKTRKHRISFEVIRHDEAATTAPKIFSAFPPTSCPRLEPARRWENATLKLKWRSFAWRQRVSWSWTISRVLKKLKIRFESLKWNSHSVCNKNDIMARTRPTLPLPRFVWNQS